MSLPSSCVGVTRTSGLVYKSKESGESRLTGLMSRMERNEPLSGHDH